jgi:hypothetical protein
LLTLPEVFRLAADNKVQREAGEMNTDRQIGNAKSPAAVVNQPAAYQHSCYVASAAVVEVLFDQLEYLVAHGGRDYPSDCLECGWLERVSTGCYCLSVLRLPPLNSGEAWGKALPL